MKGENASILNKRQKISFDGAEKLLSKGYLISEQAL